jgi:hypothetical protein
MKRSFKFFLTAILLLLVASFLGLVIATGIELYYQDEYLPIIENSIIKFLMVLELWALLTSHSKRKRISQAYSMLFGQ